MFFKYSLRHRNCGLGSDYGGPDDRPVRPAQEPSFPTEIFVSIISAFVGEQVHLLFTSCRGSSSRSHQARCEFAESILGLMLASKRVKAITSIVVERAVGEIAMDESESESGVGEETEEDNVVPV
jgi:hypothetical protein